MSLFTKGMAYLFMAKDHYETVTNETQNGMGKVVTLLNIANGLFQQAKSLMQ